MNWGDVGGSNPENPGQWLTNFIAAYMTNNGGKFPLIDFIGVHWYDYGLASVACYNCQKATQRPMWVTEMANWHSGVPYVTNAAEQEVTMSNDFVMYCETNPEIYRYSWFTARITPDPHADSILDQSDSGMTAVGSFYSNLWYGITNIHLTGN
jgi:hypothetical protein